MKGRSGSRFAACAALVAAALAALPAPVRAHDEPPEVRVYVQPMGDRVRMLVRIPVSLLIDARLPLRPDGYFDLQSGLDKTGGPVAGVAADIARNLDLMDDDRPLPNPATDWTISPRSDRSFDGADAAAARVAAVQSPDARIDANTALLDLRFDYPATRSDPRLSVRVNGFRSIRDPRMRVTYIPPQETAGRTIVTSGMPSRVLLEPGRAAAGSIFARLGVEQLTSSAVHLMFVLCLAIPLRPLRAAVRLFGIFAAAWAAGMVGSWFFAAPADPAAPIAIQTLAAAVLAIAGLQNVTTPHIRWVWIAAAAFGALDGVVFGVAFSGNAARAGSHAVFAGAAFVLPVLVGSIWLLVVAYPVIALLRRSELMERWATVLLSAIPVHTALHAMTLIR